ncbi:MAG: V-type ATP synthase subunit A [Planctomycetota bacterium]|jgi:V/A-type H+-transporting ATPase subunit A
MSEKKGEIFRISGPVVTAVGISPRMYDVVYIGNEKLMGEVIKLEGGKSVVQVYEDTSGIKPGEPVVATGEPLVVELGPGMLTQIYDGIQRPLPVLAEKMGDFIERGVSAPGLDHSRKWKFNPTKKVGDELAAGDVFGWVQETKIEHRILVPPRSKGGKIKEIKEGEFTVDDIVCVLDTGEELRLMHVWPVRVPRPFKKKLMPDIPLITGQRIFDGFFPLAKGGTAAIPGPFGSGKTVSQHQLAKWSDTELVTYVGCGERGNEMTDVLTEFPHLKDPKTGEPLMNRTVLIANTSNMPVAARECSVYTGVTIAEYFRDMGYGVSLMADSTSRWAEAMREISSRLEEMPGEEGYPAYLSAKLSQFYERAGRVITLNDLEGSVTIIGAVSPPGGDFSEPVTQNTLRIVKVFWALDAKLMQRRHFPSINWLTSYSLYEDILEDWFNKNVHPEWSKLRGQAKALLQKEAELQEIVQLVGSDSLPESEQLTLEIARMVREIFLQQNAFHDVDSFCPMEKQYELIRTIMEFGEMAKTALEKHAAISEIVAAPSRDSLAKSRFEPNFEETMTAAKKEMKADFEKMGMR